MSKPMSAEDRTDLFEQVASRLAWAVHIGEGERFGVNGVVVHRNELVDALSRAFILGQAEERERCAKVAETTYDSELFAEVGREIASSIRSLTPTTEAPDAQ